MRPVIQVEFQQKSDTFSQSSPHSPRTPSSPSFITVEGKHTKCIGNYILGKKLGRGAFCKVKVATHMQSGIKYAIKILKPSLKTSSWGDIEREIQVLSGLKHPNIIGLHDVLYIDSTDNLVEANTALSFQNAKKIFLVVDLAGNGELFDHIIKQKRLAEDESRWIFRQVLSAVEHLHAHCIAHRDLKPENILLDSSNNIKLNDFGLSNFIQPEKKMTTFCGSPVYAAPEVMRKSFYNGVIADVWSLGVILFTMVTGCLPWKLDMHTNRVENIEDLLAGRFEIPPCISTECATLLCKMLMPHPAQRATLNEVRKHPWVNKGYMDYPARFLEPQKQVTDVDKVVLKQMESMGFMQARVAEDVLENKVKPSVTVYHTLLKRRKLTLLISSAPAIQQVIPEARRSPRSPRGAGSPRNSPRGSPMGSPQRPSWKNSLDTLPEEENYNSSSSGNSSNHNNSNNSSNSNINYNFPGDDVSVVSRSLPQSRSFSQWVRELTSSNVRTSEVVDFAANNTTSNGISKLLNRRHSVPETQSEFRAVNQKEEKKKGFITRMFSRRNKKAIVPAP